jgi:hypothetical protein
MIIVITAGSVLFALAAYAALMAWDEGRAEKRRIEANQKSMAEYAKREAEYNERKARTKAARAARIARLSEDQRRSREKLGLIDHEENT